MIARRRGTKRAGTALGVMSRPAAQTESLRAQGAR